MKIAILSQTVCQPTQKIIDYFIEKGLAPDAVIIEKNFRRKYSESEKSYRNAHDLFNRKTKKYLFIRRLARQIWDIIPVPFKRYILLNVFSIPLIRNFSLHRYCLKRNIEAFEVHKHSSEETRHFLESRGVDYVLMVSSNWLLKDPILSIPDTRIINAHSGWLPKHKGLDSIGWSLLEGDPVGLTTHFIDNSIDGGDILKFYEYSILPTDKFNDVTRGIGSIQAHAFFDTLHGLKNKSIQAVIQDQTIKPHVPLSYNQLLEVESVLDSRRNTTT